MIKILLMEDDLNLCQSIQQALKKEGYSVDCCNDGESAMIYALNTDYGYDLAIVDRMLPIIDGLTIIKAMRRKQIQIPVIIITGMSALDDRVDGLDSGADDYLIKPFHIRELMARSILFCQPVRCVSSMLYILLFFRREHKALRGIAKLCQQFFFGKTKLQ